MNSATTPLKIVVSGPTGSGKTTFVRALAQRMGVPALEENMKDIYQAHGKFIQARKKPDISSPELEEAFKLASEPFVAWAQGRSKQYQTHAGFVADRWEADLLDLWLKLYADFGHDKLTRGLLRDMRNKSETFDYAVVMPLEPRFEEERNEDGLRRKSAFSLRFMSQIMTGGLIRQCPKLRVIPIPGKPMSVEERLDFIVKAIEKDMRKNQKAS